MDASWPQVDKSALQEDSMLIVLQVNGKLRGKVEVPKDIDKAELEKLALEDESVTRFTDGATVRKVIVVPGRLVNIVAN
jgi:leucyl-tRNA synthetase